MVLYCNTVACFDSFRDAYVPNEKKSYGIKNIKNKHLLNKSKTSMMCECICIRFIDFMLKGKSFLDYTIFFSLKIWKEWSNTKNLNIKM